MAKPQINKSTLISLAIHIAIGGALMLFSSTDNILVPSRSDGVEVSLVSMPNQTVEPYTPPIKTQAEPIKTLDTPADINVKPTTAPAPIPKPKTEIPKPIEKPTPTPAPVQATPLPAKTPTKVKPINKKSQINDLLGDAVSTNTASIRKGKALGGNPNGTSDSNNLIGNYADQVINAVRPFVQVPDDINPKAVATIKVELYPNLNVKSVKLIKSSGNAMYDQNVQTAIMRVKVFPALPDGANFVEYRILKLTFKPQ